MIILITFFLVHQNALFYYILYGIVPEVVSNCVLATPTKKYICFSFAIVCTMMYKAYKVEYKTETYKDN